MKKKYAKSLTLKSMRRILAVNAVRRNKKNDNSKIVE